MRERLKMGRAYRQTKDRSSLTSSVKQLTADRAESKRSSKLGRDLKAGAFRVFEHAMSKGRKMPMQRVARGFLALLVFLVTYTMTTPAAAQSFLGTIRGTVVDPQGSVVPGAAVLIGGELNARATEAAYEAERLARLMGYSRQPVTSLRDDYRRLTRRARAVVERVFYGQS